MNRHWNEEDFLNKVYELGPEDGHLGQCAACRERWEIWLARRRELLESPVVPADLLARQRERIEQRLHAGRSVRRYFAWTPAIALAGMALLAVLWRSPHLPAGARVPPAKSDAQLMTEIYQTAYASEPGAVTPIRGLFEFHPSDAKPKEISK